MEKIEECFGEEEQDILSSKIFVPMIFVLSTGELELYSKAVKGAGKLFAVTAVGIEIETAVGIEIETETLSSRSLSQPSIRI